MSMAARQQLGLGGHGNRKTPIKERHTKRLCEASWEDVGRDNPSPRS